MITLTTKEIIVLCFIILLGFTIFSAIFKSLAKIFISIALGIICFSIGFFWLPKRAEEVASGQRTISQIFEDTLNDRTELNESVKEGVQYINGNKQSWLEAVDSLAGKLTGAGQESTEQTEEPAPQ